jgi:hypothetical protein
LSISLAGITIVVTVAGVCTSLGLGAIQIVAGFQFMGWVEEDATEDKLSMIQSLTIWGITAIATASVISGLNSGVKLLSAIAFALGMLLLFLVLIMDNTKYLLNLIVQEIGYFMQWNILELNFWTDAFAQLEPGEGRATDGNAGATWYMDAWIVFYQAWWISWSGTSNAQSVMSFSQCTTAPPTLRSPPLSSSPSYQPLLVSLWPVYPVGVRLVKSSPIPWSHPSSTVSSGSAFGVV